MGNIGIAWKWNRNSQTKIRFRFGPSWDEEVNPTGREPKRKRMINKPEGVRVKSVLTPALSGHGVSRKAWQT